jgi:hypothetical protein
MRTNRPPSAFGVDDEMRKFNRHWVLVVIGAPMPLGAILARIQAEDPVHHF